MVHNNGGMAGPRNGGMVGPMVGLEPADGLERVPRSPLAVVTLGKRREPLYLLLLFLRGCFF